MTFGDIFKNSFLEGYASNTITINYVMISLSITVAIALYIFTVYFFMTRKTFYSKAFNISLVALAIITASVIITIQSSIVVSLGMVGALSIVRFRTAVKEPMDLVFLFWSISVGIVCGAGMFYIAIIGSLLLTVSILILDIIPVSKASKILIINAQFPCNENEILEIIKIYGKHYKVKSRNISDDKLDELIEIRGAIKNEYEMLKDINNLKFITSSSLIAHEGEVTY